MIGLSKATKRAKRTDAVTVTIDENLIRKQLWRTQECNFFLKGNCKRGSKCAFAHGTVEFAPDFTKTSLCEAFIQGGRCRSSGMDCPFAHGVKELRVTPLFMKKDDKKQAASPEDVATYKSGNTNKAEPPQTALHPTLNNPSVGGFPNNLCTTGQIPTSPAQPEEPCTMLQYHEPPQWKQMQAPAAPLPPALDSMPLPCKLLVLERSPATPAQPLQDRKIRLAEHLFRSLVVTSSTGAEGKPVGFQPDSEESMAQNRLSRQRTETVRATTKMPTPMWFASAFVEDVMIQQLAAGEVLSI